MKYGLCMLPAAGDRPIRSPLNTHRHRHTQGAESQADIADVASTRHVEQCMVRGEKTILQLGGI